LEEEEEEDLIKLMCD